MSKLVIVESPTKAGTISRMLDKSYRIVASMGHIRDLPERSIGVDIENNFTPIYVDTPRSRKIVADLRKMASSADEIYLAPDPDREGEAIAWHLQEVLKNKQNMNKFHRVTFHEITASAIKNAMANKGVIDMNLVDAQQARRVLDRIVGYKVSPLLWQKLEKGMSAGRVQSVALRLIVERERVIQDFKPQEYWNFSIVFANMAGVEVCCKLFKINNNF
jgi:DNA topoisomerase-1